ncbi:hypothetical protein, partial [uncultured Alistipes sp.]|uniref:hypothetical protein n=1 Tax=uncultured Alistipes sp. TaxID=538949 RepID=UPI00272D6117
MIGSLFQVSKYIPFRAYFQTNDRKNRTSEPRGIPRRFADRTMPHARLFGILGTGAPAARRTAHGARHRHTPRTNHPSAARSVPSDETNVLHAPFRMFRNALRMLLPVCPKELRLDKIEFRLLLHPTFRIFGCAL